MSQCLPLGRWAWLLPVALLACGGQPPARSCAADIGLDAAGCAQVQALRRSGALQPAAEPLLDARAVASWGYDLFFDARLSGPNSVSCASCHNPNLRFTDGKARAEGVAQVARNAPSLLNAPHYAAMFWDGRSQDGIAQALDVLENPAEMDLTRLELVHRVQALYAAPYAALFGPVPDFSDRTRFPARGRPGDAAFDGMAAADRALVNAVARQVATALAAYGRQIAVGESPLDAYLGGAQDALSARERTGLGVFVRAGCIDCHGGPNLSDGKYYTLGVPAWPGAEPDVGRAATTPEVAGALGAMRTPSLRNLRGTAPFGHNGRIDTLEAMVALHLSAVPGAAGPYAGVVDPAFRRTELSAQDLEALVAFLNATGSQPPLGDRDPPDWWNWPDR